MKTKEFLLAFRDTVGSILELLGAACKAIPESRVRAAQRSTVFSAPKDTHTKKQLSA